MKRECIEIWSDSFHEGDWCCSSLAQIALSNGFSVKRDYVRGLQPHYVFSSGQTEIELLVFGSYKSWSPLPEKVKELIDWGKPDFVAYSAAQKSILFAVEETAATPTGNQAMQDVSVSMEVHVFAFLIGISSASLVFIEMAVSEETPFGLQ